MVETKIKDVWQKKQEIKVKIEVEFLGNEITRKLNARKIFMDNLYNDMLRPKLAKNNPKDILNKNKIERITQLYSLLKAS